jgi:drug/metabolite transporter (DMT)-like permease
MAVLVRAAARDLPLGETLLIRFGIATLGAAFAQRVLGPETGGRPRLLVLRGVLGGVAVVLYYIALFRLPAATAALLNCSSPLFAILFAQAFLEEDPPRGVWLGIGLATAGTALVVLGSAEEATAASILGLLAGIASAAFSGGAIPSIRAARRYYNAGTVFLAFSISGLAVSLPVAIGESWRGGMGLALGVGAGLAALGAQLTYTQALGQVEIWLASALGQLTPVAAWLIGLVTLREQLSSLALAGALVTGVGVAFASSRERPAPAVAAL